MIKPCSNTQVDLSGGLYFFLQHFQPEATDYQSRRKREPVVYFGFVIHIFSSIKHHHEINICQGQPHPPTYCYWAAGWKRGNSSSIKCAYLNMICTTWCACATLRIRIFFFLVTAKRPSYSCSSCHWPLRFEGRCTSLNLSSPNAPWHWTVFDYKPLKFEIQQTNLLRLNETRRYHTLTLLEYLTPIRWVVISPDLDNR